ncbi:MAG TPA: glycosyltransferase family 4 protein, partial [Puia sp.]|nr:glycosyltransferase family 4 protein [Puia sp.]
MTKILVTSWLPADARSGVGTYMRKLQDYFKNDPGIDITFLLVDQAPLAWRILASLVRRAIRSFAFLDRRCIELSFEMYYRILVRGGLSRYRNTHFDVINAQDILSGFTAKKFFGGKVPLVLTCHFNNNPVEEDMLRYGLGGNARAYLTRRYKRKFAAVDEFIFVAGFTIRTAGFLLPAGARTTVIYNGLDFTPSPARTRSGALLSILNTGYVEERKNQRLFIPLAKELLRRNFRNFRITLVGTGPDLQKLQRTVAEEGLSDYIHLAGWSDNIPAFL